MDSRIYSEVVFYNLVLSAIDRRDVEELQRLWRQSSASAQLGPIIHTLISQAVPALANRYDIFSKKNLTFQDLVKYYNYRKLCGSRDCFNFFVERGDLDNVKIAIEMRNLNSVRDWNKGLGIAVEKGYSDLIKFFVDKGADKLAFALDRAAFWGDQDLIDFLIEKNALGFGGVRRPSEPGEEKVNEWNLGLMGAAEGGHKDLVEFFIEKGADDWLYAIYGAGKGGQQDLVLFFLGDIPLWENSDLFAVPRGPWTRAELLNSALNGVVDGKRRELAQFLVDQGANANRPDLTRLLNS